MKLVGVRFKNGVNGTIKEGQKMYEFICPIETIELGDYVMVEVYSFTGRYYSKRSFAMGRVDSIFEFDEEKMLANKKAPFSFVFCKVPVDVEARCQSLQKLKKRLERRGVRFRKKVGKVK